MTPQLLEDIAQETKKGQHKLHVINYLLAHQTATMTDIAKELAYPLRPRFSRSYRREVASKSRESSR